MPLNGDVSEFEEGVDLSVRSAFAAGTSTFSQLLGQLSGVYPSDVLDSLSRIRLMAAGGALARWCDGITGEAANSPMPPTDAFGPTVPPIPHPLDFDWRFTENSAGFVADLAAREAAASNGAVLLLGTPTVARAIVNQRTPPDVYLLDKNAAEYDLDVTKRAGDLTESPLPTLPPAAVVVADPPWYQSYFRSFLWVAARAALPGARVFCGFPGLGTRPGVQGELDHLAHWSESVGLRIENVRTSVTEYLTPPFEANALRAVGITNIPIHWRRASLIEFRFIGKTTVPRPPQPKMERWDEVVIGSVRWRVRRCPELGQGNAPLRELIVNDVLPSVSRRHPLRNSAQVWTSGNRIFKSDNPQMLRDLLRVLQSVGDVKTAAGKIVRQAFGNQLAADGFREAEQATTKIMGVCDTETREYAAGL